MQKRILIAYFSHGGENLIDDKVVNIGTEGNTAQAAKILEKQLIERGFTADLYEISPLEPYSFFYAMVASQAREEKEKSSYPKLIAGPTNFNDYDIVFLGYPNWWGSCPRLINSFLKEHDFKGKTVIPFVTHGGQLFLYSLDDIQHEIPGVKVKEGFAIYANYMENASLVIKDWISENITVLK